MSLKNKKILITGGAGFVGSNIVNKLINSRVETIILDDFSTGKIENISSKNENLEIIKGDIRHYDSIRNITDNVDIVIHLAARNIIASVKNPRIDSEVNIIGTLNVLHAAMDSGIKKFIYSSSASVYGNLKNCSNNEEDPTNPLSTYGVSKLGGENYCRMFFKVYGLQTSILRYFNVYGPNQNPENPYSGVICKFLNNVLNGLPPQIHGDGKQTRDFTFIDDIVDGTLLAVESSRATGKIFNVGSGIETSINELADEIIELCGKTEEIKPVYIEKREIDNVERRSANTDEIQKVLKWKCHYTLHAGLESTLKWFKTRKEFSLKPEASTKESVNIPMEQIEDK